MSLSKQGDKKVEIKKDKYGLYISITKNGYQWTSTEIDNEILGLIIDCIEMYKKVDNG